MRVAHKAMLSFRIHIVARDGTGAVNGRGDGCEVDPGGSCEGNGDVRGCGFAVVLGEHRNAR